MLDEDSPIKVAQYYTKLPDKKLLSEKLQRAIAIAREHYAEKIDEEKNDLLVSNGFSEWRKRFHAERNRSWGENACSNQKSVVPLQRIWETSV